jgi:hypothetical protein
MKSGRLLVTLAAVFGFCAGAKADMFYPFDTSINANPASPDFTQNVAWSPHVGGAAQSTMTTGGWTLGSGPRKEFSWVADGGVGNQQTTMQGYANAGNYRVAFDLMVDGASFPVAGSDWYQFQVAGNSDGSQGWAQISIASAQGLWHNDGDQALYSWHADYSFADMGWQPGDTWFQMFFGVQSGAIPVQYYIDNINVYAVPEPSMIGLAGLGAALLIFRRRG